MTREEVCSICEISKKIIKEYEEMKINDADNDNKEILYYDENDVEKLSIMLTLMEIGFSKTEIKKYMTLLEKGNTTERERIKMLNSHRNKTLDQIHLRERQLERMDYLRYKLKK